MMWYYSPIKCSIYIILIQWFKSQEMFPFTTIEGN